MVEAGRPSLPHCLTHVQFMSSSYHLPPTSPPATARLSFCLIFGQVWHKKPKSAMIVCDAYEFYRTFKAKKLSNLPVGNYIFFVVWSAVLSTQI